jgi:superfamily II DNA/RNA helicase
MLNGFLRRYRKHPINYARRKNTWLFSATMPAEVARIGKQFMKDPLKLQ